MNRYLHSCRLFFAMTVSLLIGNTQTLAAESFTFPETELRNTVFDPGLASRIADHINGNLSAGGQFFDLSANSGAGRYLGSVTVLRTGYGTTILYINGMRRSRIGFEEDVSLLKQFVSEPDGLPHAYGGLGVYNTWGVQHALETVEEFCVAVEIEEWITTDDSLIQDCQGVIVGNGRFDEYMQLVLQYFTFPAKLFLKHDIIDYPTVQNLKETIKLTVDAGQKVIIVAHSQGNFYVRDALTLLMQEPYGYQFAKSIGVLSLGSPILAADFPSAVAVRQVSECYDPIALFSFKGTLFGQGVNSCVLASGGEPLFYPLVNWNIKAHDFAETYLGNPVVANEVKKSLRILDASTLEPRKTFESSNRVISVDRLNVRDSGGNLKYTIQSGARGKVFSEAVSLIDGYYRSSIQFDDNNRITFPDGTVSIVGDLPFADSFGFVATGWLRYDTGHSESEVVASNNTVQPLSSIQLSVWNEEQTVLRKAEPQFYSSYNLPVPSSIPDDNGDMGNLDGCTNCSGSPAPFEITSATSRCRNGRPEIRVLWNNSAGANTYSIYANLDLAKSGRSRNRYTIRENLLAGEDYSIFVKSLNEYGSRNSSNAIKVSIPHSICGAPEPPQPYDGPVPAVDDLRVTMNDYNSARLEAKIVPNGVTVTGIEIEYGTSHILASSITAPSIDSSHSEVVVSDSISTSCGNTYHYRFAVHHAFGTVHSHTMTFNAPACTSPAPENLELEHDPTDNSILVRMEEVLYSSETTQRLWRLIISDPRPGVVLGKWEYIHDYPANIGEIRDIYTLPQAGAEYCYRVQPIIFANGSTGEGDNSETVCITIEGEFVQQVQFPSSVGIIALPDIGIQIDTVGGEGHFDIERRHNEMQYIVVDSFDSHGGHVFVDQDVVPGETYCYRFTQNNLYSTEYCEMYFDSSMLGEPTLLELTRNGSFADAAFTSEFPHAGFFQLEYQHPSKNFVWDSEGTYVYQGSDPMIKRIYSDPDHRACYRIMQVLGSVRSSPSNVLCLEVGEENAYLYPPDVEPPEEDPPVEDPPEEPPVEEPPPEEPPEEEPPVEEFTLPQITVTQRSGSIDIRWSGSSYGRSDMVTIQMRKVSEANFRNIDEWFGRSGRYVDMGSDLEHEEEYCYRLKLGTEVSNTGCVVYDDPFAW